MIRTLMVIGRTAAWSACLALGLGAAAQADTVVYSNNVGGDSVVGPTSDTPIGGSGWMYSDVRIGGTIGISSALPRSGNGSVLFQGDPGALNNQSYKADVSLTSSKPLGLLSNLTSFSYDWYRDSSSTTANYRMPALRLLVSNGTSWGYLVYEQVYQQSGNQAALTNQWVTATVTDSTNLWSTTSGGLPSTPNYYNSPLSGWKTTLAGYSVYGISSGIGSGWTDGTFRGAVDNIHIGFGTDPGTTFNFEVQPVPEPASMVSMLAAGAFGLAGAAYRRRRARRA